MCSNPENTNSLEPDCQSNSPPTVGSQPWWRSNAAPPESASKASLEPSDSKSHGSGSGGGDEGGGVGKEVSQSGSDGNHGSEHQHLQHVASTVPPTGGEYLVPQTQLELIGHSIGCTPFAYSDPYYGGLMTAYGTQALVNPHLLGMPRMPLPLEMTEEPVYVNAKQYRGILRRRQSRAKAELEKKLIKVRKPYLHESRHQHAMRRARGCGGRFLNTKKLNDGENPKPGEGMKSAAARSTQSTSPSNSDPLTTQCSRKLKSSNGQEEVKGEVTGGDMHGPHTYSDGNDNGNNCYQHHQGFRLSTYHPLSGERGEEGDCSGQQRGSIPVSQAPHRALTIQ